MPHCRPRIAYSHIGNAAEVNGFLYGGTSADSHCNNREEN
jgi:hypothetical protein